MRSWTFDDIRAGKDLSLVGDEPDKAVWTDEATGLPLMVKRHPHTGHLCGYVGVGKDHPLHGVGYGDESPALVSFRDRRLQRPVGYQPGMAVMIAALRGELRPTPDEVFEVHGGITYSAPCDGDPERGICHPSDDGDHVWWFGFDCHHSGDIGPWDDPEWSSGGMYRDFGYVRRECERLAAQLAAVEEARA